MSKGIEEGEFKRFISEDIYNKAANTGSKAYNVDMSTINNLIEVFQGDPIDACLLLMVYIKRQEKRGEIRRPFSQLLLQDIKYMYDAFKSDKGRLELAIRKYLTLVKWVKESRIPDVNDINSFINAAIRG
ncbi:MAG: hypothetical protein RMJ59_05925 [Candidatus Nitrosocaldus sp.]|nr:hypothetical protein [Candidatus Nitrosocaldus sp.]